jgi:hypothetical protein
MAQFMLLMRGGAMEYLAYSPEEIQQAIQKYEDWARRLIEQGQLRGGDKLRDDGGRLVRSQSGQIVVDGPFAETKETVGGYFRAIRRTRGKTWYAPICAPRPSGWPGSWPGTCSLASPRCTPCWR